jgi:hemolysin III
MFKLFPEHLPEELEYDIKTLKEEVANMYSHGAGLVIFVAMTPFLVYTAYRSGNHWFLWGAVIFCASLVMLYTASTLYHCAYGVRLRQQMRIFDHISIYFLIAGSYTPFIFTHFKDGRGWAILTTLWAMTLVGTVFKLFYTHKFKVVSTIAYMVMGWMVVLIIKPLVETVPTICFTWIAIGGACYTIGVIFYLWEKLYHNHLIWHLFVLAGSLSHFVAVWYCLG